MDLTATHPENILKGNRILVVEDDFYLAKDLAARLCRMGAEVMGPSANIEDALGRISMGEGITGAILDINLADEMVFPVADELERIALPFVFATGYEPDVVPARHADKVILRKPLDDDSLTSALMGAINSQPVSNEDAALNGILGRLPKTQLSAITPLLRKIYLPRGSIMELPHQTVSRVYFPIDCVGSLIAVGREETRIETGLIGSEGLTGLGLLVGDEKTPHELINQVEGFSFTMAAEDFVKAFDLAPDLHLIASRFARAMNVQISHTALANGKFEVRHRLARWLLMVHDRTLRESFNLTHDFLAVMLGIRRSSVTDALHILEGERLIRAGRGNIEIKDRRGLISVAGETYGLTEDEYDRIMNLPMTRPLEKSLSIQETSVREKPS